jgi:hypothetical protein
VVLRGGLDDVEKRKFLTLPGPPCSLQPPTHAGSSFADFATLKMEAIRASETSVHTRSTQRHTPEGGIPQSHRCENLTSYI